MSNTSKPIWLIPDTNILIGELERFINVLSQHKDRNIIIGIPQIPVEEIGQSLYIIACGYQKAMDEFRKHLEEILSKFDKEHLQVKIVPILGVYGISGYNMSYYGGKKSKDFMTQTIRKYLNNRKYMETLKYLKHCGLKIDQRDCVELFREGLSICCNLPNSTDENCRNRCKKMYGVLADTLILSAVDYLYQIGDKVIMVSNDKIMCKTANELIQGRFYNEKSVKCTTMEKLEEILKKELSSSFNQ